MYRYILQDLYILQDPYILVWILQNVLLVIVMYLFPQVFTAKYGIVQCHTQYYTIPHKTISSIIQLHNLTVLRANPLYFFVGCTLQQALGAKLLLHVAGEGSSTL